MTALPKRFFTPEEYLLLEDQSPYKSQYIDGEIFPMGEDVTSRPSAMGGACPNHVLVAMNVALSLGWQFRGKNCWVFSSDMRVAVEPGQTYTYPDVSALCGEPKYETGRQPPSLLNPQVICEVLSPSTEAFDRGEKFACYRRLESLTDYLLVYATRMSVEHHVRAGATWVLTDYTRLDQTIPLTSTGSKLPLADIYDKITFPGV